MPDLRAQLTAQVDHSIGFDVVRANRLIDESGNAWLDELQYFEKIDSTNAFLLRQADSIHGLVCAADKQTNGRGRMGRQWQGALSPNIALSIGWQPNKAIGSALSLVVGVAVAQTLHAFGVSDAGLKWPNDILVNKQKIGGILVEAVNQGGDARYVVGLGLNLRLSPDESICIEQAWTDMHSLGVSVDRTEWVATLVGSIASAITVYADEGIEPFRCKWNKLHVFDGQNVEFMLGNAISEGKILGVSDEGALLMLVDGEQRSFVAGEIKVTI